MKHCVIKIINQISSRKYHPSQFCTFKPEKEKKIKPEKNNFALEEWDFFYQCLFLWAIDIAMQFFAEYLKMME